MINVLSYLGMNMQSEVCLWTLLGLLRTIFDATLFKVNANLKQVWQMNMPEELSKPVQRVLRTMISGVMLVQCFTVYVYLATYIVLLYPVFLEERPTLVLPWLLLAAIRKLLCELTSLALGLGTCVLLGPARPPCIRFVIVKFISITPAFYMWMLVYSYYHALKVAAAFKIFPATLASSDPDYGLELAVRRRRTKSLLDENQLRKKLVANLYVERNVSIDDYQRPRLETPTKMAHSTDTNSEETQPETSTQSLPVSSRLSTKFSEVGAYEDWFGSEVTIPRDTDRILEQIVLMLLRISVYIRKEGWSYDQILNSTSLLNWGGRDCTAMPADDAEPPPQVGSNMGKVRTASYLRNYPQIFMKSQSPENVQSERKVVSTKSGPEVNQNASRNASHRKVHQVTSHSSDKNIDITCSIILSNESMSSRAETSGLNKNIVMPDTENDENNKNDQLMVKESETENSSLKQTVKQNSFDKSIVRDQSENLEILKSEDILYNPLNNDLKTEGAQGSTELVITTDTDRSQHNITSLSLEKNITSDTKKKDEDNKNNQK